ncbi:hypothetical protein [Vibrio paracholerae]|uniref:hypothetical protein n=1 Tax=Vibrio paracholerae TaxID=650003 RepID=UPI002095FF51|nr:hypothetical protein [Vibrio paracholerae]MCO7020288.1 hypothetical protein [Vibrio paracholerae]
MAIDAGTVYYTVDAKTQKAIDSAAEMKDSLEQIQTAMAKTDVQTRQYTKALNEAGNSISKAGVVLDQFGNVNAEATAKMQKLMAMTDSLNQRHIQLSKTATGVRTGLAGMGRGAGQASIQFQQLIGQIQGGQDAMLALSQQSADLGFVLGAPLLGAVVGIGASLAGMLIPNLFKTTDALEDVEKATERVKAAITLSSEGITGYSEQMKVLAQVSDQLARIKIANLIADQANAMKVASTGINETISEFNGLNYQMDLFGNKSDDAFQAFIQLSQAAKSFEADPSGSITKLESALDAATRAGINNTEAGRGLVSQITDLIAQYKLGEITIDQLNKKLDESTIKFDDVGKAAEKAANKQKQWADNAERLSVKTEELRSKQLELEKAIALKNAAEEGATPETIKSMEASYDKMIANAKEAESEKALAKSKRDRAAAERDSQKASKDFIKNFGDEDFSTNADTEATGFSRTITSTYDEESVLERLDRERNLIQMYQELEIGDAQAHADAIKAIDQEIADEKKKALDDQVKEQRNATNAQLNIYSQLFSGMQSLTSNMLASMDEQSSGYKAMFAVNKAFAVAQAIVSAELAAAQVLAHDAGIMGMSAAATSNAIRAMGYASAGVIAGTAIAGGRLYGGAVQANGMYRINENGAPEVFNAANGQQYMLPNTRGEVVSNKDASGSGGTVIQVNISSDGSVSTDGGSMMAQFGKEIGQFVDAKFKQLQSQSMRQGGALWQYKQNG